MHVCTIVLLQYTYSFSVQWRTQGGGREDRPPEIGKIVVEIWCYLPEVYTFGAESEIQEIFIKKL